MVHDEHLCPETHHLPQCVSQMEGVTSPAPMREPDGGCDLVGHPAGPLVVSEQPDVVPASVPVPVWEMLLDPLFGLQNHHGRMRNT